MSTGDRIELAEGNVLQFKKGPELINQQAAFLE
jgi:hypothetical protein